MSVPLTNRPYDEPRDGPGFRRFLTGACGAAGPAGGCFHLGDFLWQRYRFAGFPAAERIRVWETEEGGMAGFAWFYPPNEVALRIDPRLRAGPTRWPIAEEMLAWAEECRATDASAGLGEASAAPLTVSELESDRAFAEWIAARGFVRADHPPMLLFRRALDAPLPGPAPTPGFTIRPLVDGSEFAERVALHREVWAPSNATVDGYAAMRAIDGCDPGLDLVAAQESGAFAAYAIGWWDPVTRSAELEPVGARAAHRRQGLTRAVLDEMLRRLHRRGAEVVYVLTGEDRAPARRLYESVGFTAIDRLVAFARGPVRDPADPRRSPGPG